MKKWKKILLTAIPATLALSFTALAGEWHLDMNGWWYETDDGSYYRNGWYWIDDNEDGLAECYYFSNKGYVVDTYGKVDGYEINEDGAWTVNGEVQRIAVEVDYHNDPAAMEVYKTAQAKNNDLDSMDTDVSYWMEMDMDGTVIETGMDMNMKIRGAKTGNLEFVADGSMNMLGTESQIQMFYTGGVYYMDMLGMKISQSMPMEEALETANSSVEGFTDADEKMMRNLAMRTEGEDTILTYEINASYMNELLGGVMDAMPTEESGFSAEYQINEASGEIVIDSNGYYTSQTMKMDMDLSMTELETGETTTVGYVMDVYMNINNPGQEVSFELPSTEGYMSIDGAYEEI